jgi:hypothetical protein
VKRGYLVLCEDRVQRAYLEWLKVEFDHPLLSIRLLPIGLDIAEALAYARKMWSTEKKRGTHFDEAWCLWTPADHVAFADALRLADAGRVKLAATIGQFAAWLEMHWRPDESLPTPLIAESSAEGFGAALAGRLNIASRRAEEEELQTTTMHHLVLELSRSADEFARRPIR